jgi:hypothetical protein
MEQIAVNVIALEIKETQMSPELTRLHKNADALLARINQRKANVALATKQDPRDAEGMAWLLTLSPKEAEHVALHAQDGGLQPGASYFLNPQVQKQGMTLPTGKGAGLGDTPGKEKRQESYQPIPKGIAPYQPMHFRTQDAVSDTTDMKDILWQLGVTPEEFAAQQKLNDAKQA